MQAPRIPDSDAEDEAKQKVHLAIVEYDAPTSSLAKDGRHIVPYPADVRGRFDRARKIVFHLLIGLWAALPWIPVRGHPAVFVDIEHRKFFLFGATFNAQDTWLLFFLVTGLGFGLLYATAVLGRAWCGWACPQTVFMEGVFRRVERLIEGPREAHMRRDHGPWTLEKVARKATKQIAFLALSFGIAHMFLAYFVSLPRAWELMHHAPGEHIEAFLWTFGAMTIVYLDFAFFRERFCVFMCPYGRLQSVLVDDDSITVGYDAKRGEPRGKKGTEGAGDCVDCKRCIVVCPTGIDIRNGMQLDCVACTACIDACDDVMDKLKRPRGLIRYDSLRAFTTGVRRFVRPRVIVYTVALAVGIVVFALSARRRADFEANLLRLRGAPYVLDGDQIRNSFELHVYNKRGEREAYAIEPEATGAMTFVVPIATVTLESMTDQRVPVFVTLPRASYAGDVDVKIHVRRVSDPRDEIVTTGKFLGTR